MFGSDWPVCLVAAPYARVLAIAQALVGCLAPAQQDAVFAGAATAGYRLQLERPVSSRAGREDQP
jgi:L-fuconolactonase